MNGHTLDTLREMSQKAKITPSVGLPILFGAMADMIDSIKELGSNQSQSKDERGKMSDDINKLSGDMQDLADKIDCQTKAVDELKNNIEKNPAIVVGTFVQKYRKFTIFLASMFGILFIVFLTAWSLPGVRIGVMTYIGIPQEIILFLNP